MKQSVLFINLVVFLLFVISCLSQRSITQSSNLTNRSSSANAMGKTHDNDISLANPRSSPRHVPANISGAPENFQSRFGPEIDFDRASPIPESIWKSIQVGEKNADLKKELLKDDKAASWVLASQINLNNDEMPDYVVMAHRAPLAGANITTFWIFLNSTHGFRKVLETSALEINILDKPKKGLRSISGSRRVGAEGVTVIFNYDGVEYRPVSTKTIPL